MNTSQQYDTIISKCEDIFTKKTKDYGTAWRILRTSSLTDQIFIKAQRIRTLEDKGVNKVGESIEDEFIGIINYCIMAIIQLELKDETNLELETEIASIVNYLPNVLEINSPDGGVFNYSMEISDMWGICYKKNDYTRVHDHWPATWSGTFYLDIPTDYAGTLFFPELEHNIEPVTGQLVIFSGTTKHGVKTIQSNGERLAISFNYNVK